MMQTISKDSPDERRCAMVGPRHAALALTMSFAAALALVGGFALLGALTDDADAAETSVRLTREEASPAKVFWAAARKARFEFEIGGERPRDVRVQAVRRSSGEVQRTWRLERVEPGRPQVVRWDGSRRNGRPAPVGEHVFRVRVEGSAVDRSRATGDRRVEAYSHKFPVRGRHTYGDGFGAGRGHQGQDVFARCGTKLVAARAGRVEHRGWHSSAGRYVVVDGRRTGRDYVYMHLRRRTPVREGQRVRTGEVLGAVGRTGNASGCHLHYELWSRPGWYEGGRALRSVTRALRRWDGWS